jgi:hypothetical protein
LPGDIQTQEYDECTTATCGSRSNRPAQASGRGVTPSPIYLAGALCGKAPTEWQVTGRRVGSLERAAAFIDDVGFALLPA